MDTTLANLALARNLPAKDVLPELKLAFDEATAAGIPPQEFFTGQATASRNYNLDYTPSFVNTYVLCGGGSGTLRSPRVTTQALTKGCSRKLTRQMEADPAFGQKPIDHDAHHIVGGNIQDPRKCENSLRFPGINFCDAARDILQIVGITDVNISKNGVYLPATSTVSNPVAATPHANVHTKLYFENVYGELQALNAQSPADLTRVLNKIDTIRQELIAGTFQY
ncbi:MAG: hypothetical protein HC933_16665 [Pleurocapsa sp. SU_196_0]|nr:hypothetical protein [Pleurocapsa sp. SU_196_0]